MATIGTLYLLEIENKVSCPTTWWRIKVRSPIFCTPIESKLSLSAANEPDWEIKNRKRMQLRSWNLPYMGEEEMECDTKHMVSK